MQIPLLGAAALALAAPGLAVAQDHTGHHDPASAPAGPGEEYCVVSLEGREMTCRDAATVGSVPVEPKPALPGSIRMHPQPDHAAHHDHPDLVMPASMGGEGSGTSRLPPNEMMSHGVHLGLGSDAALMLHGFAWGVYTEQTGPRGDDKAYVQSMAMARYEDPFEGGKFTATAMLSLEPAMSRDGYPNLFATGETAFGEPLVDRQHPHDFVMELAARLDVDIAPATTAFLYGGPVGEPALGPSAFMHRASARYNPEAPITHHWFDSTHITYGVVTAGVAAPRWQVEASAFRGREPDEARWNIETPRLDSWSVRASFAPAEAWLLQASYGEMEEPEALHPGEDEHRTTASAHYNNGRGLSAMAAFSAKDRVPGETLTAWLAEVNWDLTNRHTLFGRFENVANDELFHDHHHLLHDATFRISKLQAGYAYRLPLGPFRLALGGTIAGFVKPAALDPFYGNNPMGYTVFTRLSLGD